VKLALGTLAVVLALLPVSIARANPADQPVLPDHAMTPGVTNPAVTQATIATTICVSHWTATVRPPASYTDKLKLKQMPLYHETGSPSDYEEDHLVPLELGGAPQDERNLWPEPHSQSSKSDPLETALKRKVCAHPPTLTLRAARQQILSFKRKNG
jgi:hypothetical protein